LKRYTL